ncbi:hypothetical protein FRB97_008318 [Tulasnella sp. 331]|nr:hypothetical protein FRB97_008318 [Tulasnella sp. 331]
MGFKDIHAIDMDTIDISNLNRQFLFRHANTPKDVGHPKATVAAEYIMKRVPGVKVTPFFGKIQDKDEAYYMQFKIVICGLDSIEARRLMNATLVSMAEAGESEESFKPLIDGGTEGFKGQSRVILPTVSSCYECSLDMLNKPTVFPICTIANTPRLLEHCFTWTLTQGVVKNIIPAIVSTHAIIAASCCNEAFKIMTSPAPQLKKPSLSTSSGNPVYWEGATPVALATRTKEHLEAKVRELVPEDEEVEVTSPALPFKLTLKLTYV